MRRKREEGGEIKIEHNIYVQTDRQTQRFMYTDTDIATDTDTHTHTDTDTDTDTDTRTHIHTHTQMKTEAGGATAGLSR